MALPSLAALDRRAGRRAGRAGRHAARDELERATQGTPC